MPEAYSKPCQALHSQNSLFRLIQRHLAIFSHVQAYWETWRHIQALLRHIEPYSDIFRTLWNPCIISHVQNPGTFTTQDVFKSLSNDIKDIKGYSATFRGGELGGGVGQASPALFWKLKKSAQIGKIGPDYAHLCVKFSIQNIVLKCSCCCCVFHKMIIKVPWFHETSSLPMKSVWLHACTQALSFLQNALS